MSKNKYEAMNYDELRHEHKRLNKFLIFPNILIVAISVIACIMQMLMPFFQVSVTIDSNVVASVVDFVYEDYGDDDPIIESDNSVLTTLLTKNNIKDMTSTLNTTLSFQMKSMDLLALALASDETAEEEIVTLLASYVENMHISDEIEKALNDMMPTVISTAVTTVVTEQIVASLAEGEELTEEQTAAIETASTEITASVQKLATSDSETIDTVKEEVKVEVSTSVTTAMEELGYTEEDIASVSDEIDSYIDAFIEAAIDEETNTFSYLTLVSNMDTLVDALNSYTSGEITDEELGELIEDLTGGDSSSDSGDTSIELTAEQEAYIISIVGEEAYNNLTDEQKQYYIDLYNSLYGASYSGGTVAVKHTLTADETGTTSAEDETATIKYYINLLNDSEALVRELLGDNLNDETIQTIKTGAMGVFAFVVATSALWAILALFALLHIILPNKKVGMWYVKLFGAAAAILFFVVPSLLIVSATSLVPTIAATVEIDASILTTVFGSIVFGGSGMYVLICLLALWIVSIFICHPIKKKIKKCKKELKKRS